MTYFGLCNVILQVRLSDDSKYVVFIDRQDASLHVVELNLLDARDWSFRRVASCFTHAPSSVRLVLRCAGRVAVIRDGAHILCILVIKDGGGGESQDGDEESVDYTSVWHRANSVLAPCRQRLANAQQTILHASVAGLERDDKKSGIAPLTDRPLSSTKNFRQRHTPLAGIKTAVGSEKVVQME